MVGVDTIDGRRINPDGLSLPEPATLLALTRSGEQFSQAVGEITEISRADGGELRGSGWVYASLLPAGRRTFPCGLEVDVLRIGADPPAAELGNEQAVIVVEECRVRGLALYLDPDMVPAWPGCEITLAE